MKKLLLVLSLMCLYAFIGMMAQQDRAREYIAWIDRAEQLYDLDRPTAASDSTALGLFMKAATAAELYNDYNTAADACIKAGNIHQTYQRYSEANKSYHRALAISAAYLKSSRINYEAFLCIGSSCYFSNIIDSAQYYFEKASYISLHHRGEKLPDEERLYNSLGAIYFESANYTQAKNYFEKALMLARSDADDYEESFVGIKSNIANCLLRLNQFDSALAIYGLLATYQMPGDVGAVILQNMAHTYFQLGAYDSALALYRRLPADNPLNNIKALNDVGRIFMNRGQWRQSETTFDSAIAVNKRISATIKNKEEAKAYLYRGQLAARQGLIDEAITWSNEALQEIHLDFRWKRFDDLPGQVSQTVSPITLFEILQNKASFLFAKYQSSGQQQLLAAALHSYRKAIETADFIKLNFDNDESKLFFNTNYKSIYGEALRVAYESALVDERYADDYVFMLESYKGTVIYQNLQSIGVKSSAGIPGAVKNREREIKQLLAFYTTRLNSNAAEEDVPKLQRRLLELQVELSRLQKQYENDRTYSQDMFKATGTISALPGLQKAAGSETAFLNYYVGDTGIYLLAVSGSGSLVSKIPFDKALRDNLSAFCNETYGYEEGRRYAGAAGAAYLYDALVRPVEKLVNACSRWVIIPDGPLYYLPFEALVTNKRTNQYVVENRIVSYHYSFSLLMQEHDARRNNRAGRNAFAVAPFASDDAYVRKSGLAPLRYSGEEINKYMQKALTGAAATKQQFLLRAPDFSLLHLATHASIGADSAANWIQFYPEGGNALNNRLYVPEIYNMDLHGADLVILSACETAGGASLPGEGLLSISRAFLYAGSDGIISTLWNSEDKVTSFLMTRLHYHLDNDIPPEEALRMAKMDLLTDKKIGARYKTPNYWSNFIYTGKIARGSRNAVATYIVLSLGIGVIAFTIWYMRKFRRRGRNFLR